MLKTAATRLYDLATYTAPLCLASKSVSPSSRALKGVGLAKTLVSQSAFSWACRRLSKAAQKHLQASWPLPEPPPIAQAAATEHGQGHQGSLGLTSSSSQRNTVVKTPRLQQQQQGSYKHPCLPDLTVLPTTSDNP